MPLDLRLVLWRVSDQGDWPFGQKAKLALNLGFRTVNYESILEMQPANTPPSIGFAGLGPLGGTDAAKLPPVLAAAVVDCAG